MRYTNGCGALRDVVLCGWTSILNKGVGEGEAGGMGRGESGGWSRRGSGRLDGGSTADESNAAGGGDATGER